METTQRSPGHGIESGIICQLGEQRLRTTNGVERLNEAIRRRERIIRIFPTHASMIRLVGTLLMEQDEGWTTGKRYFDMSAYWQWSECRLTQVALFPTAEEVSMIPAG